jgi:hypothetical protein
VKQDRPPAIFTNGDILQEPLVSCTSPPPFINALKDQDEQFNFMPVFMYKALMENHIFLSYYTFYAISVISL